jgi:hypothetical protein
VVGALARPSAARQRALRAMAQARAMAISRQTFVVQVREADRLAVLENVQTRECVRLGDLAEIGAQIARWLDGSQEVEQCSSSEEDVRG